MIMEAFSLPKKSDEEKELRNEKIQEGTKKATLIPFSVLEKSKEVAKLALCVAEKGNKNSLSDAGVAGLTASAASEGALYNVMINLQSIDDKDFKSKLAKEAVQVNKEVQQVVKKIKKI
jgi:glutamate formiminotransferase/formiminotetrahydrofolate cyclodeaminase